MKCLMKKLTKNCGIDKKQKCMTDYLIYGLTFILCPFLAEISEISFAVIFYWCVGTVFIVVSTIIAIYIKTAKVRMKTLIEEIIDSCDKLCAEETLVVSEFGDNKDLTLHIYKDCDYHPDVDPESSNLVTIVTEQDGRYVDDTENTYVTDGSLYDELERIYNYRDLCTL